MSQLVWPFDGDIRLPVEIPSPAVIIISASGPVFFYKFITCSVNSSWWHWSRCCQVCVCVHHIWVWAAATARNLHLMWGVNTMQIIWIAWPRFPPICCLAGLWERLSAYVQEFFSWFEEFEVRFKSFVASIW